MENILKALELAKGEKHQEIDQGNVEHLNVLEKRIVENLGSLEREKAETAKKPARNSNSFSYTHTRVVNTDAEVLRGNRVIAGLEAGTVVESYRLLRTQVLQRMREQDWMSLAITSPTRHAGKSLTAVNLAISMAMEVNQTVLLVDLDLRKPSIHEYFGYCPVQGISDYLHDDIPLSEILFNPTIERLVILPGHESVAHSSEALSTPRMAALVDELKHRYPNRLVLFDLPPILSADDALAFSPYVDAVLLVIEDGGTTTEELTRTIEILEPVNIIGTVLNKSRD